MKLVCLLRWLTAVTLPRRYITVSPLTPKEVGIIILLRYLAREYSFDDNSGVKAMME